MSCISAPDPQLTRLANAIAQRVGQERFNVWFDNSTKLDLRQDGLEIAVPNDFIGEWIGRNFVRPIQEATCEVLGCSLPIRFSVVPQLFFPGTNGSGGKVNGNSGPKNGNGASTRSDHGIAIAEPAKPRLQSPDSARHAETAIAGGVTSVQRLRHDLSSFVTGPANQLAFSTANIVADSPGTQYNPLFIHGSCGLGKTHLLQGLCRRFAEVHPTRRWMYLTAEDFTNEFLSALRSNRVENFRAKVRGLDLLVIDDVHFLSGKRATQEEFLHTFNSIEAMGRQVVIASDNHPKMIEAFSESLINRFVSGMVVRIDPPNHAMRIEILRGLSLRSGLCLSDDVLNWLARRVTQNVRELEGAVTRVSAFVKLTGQNPDLDLVQQGLGDLERQMVAPVKPENILAAVCTYFGLDMKDLMSGRRQRTISLARSIAMHLIRKTAKLSFPEIGMRMGKRNHSTVISACRRMERASERNERLAWSSAIGEREEEALELIQRLEELSRSMN